MADVQLTVNVVTGALLGTCLDLHRGWLPVHAVGGVVTHLLMVLGVNARKADRLVSTPLELAMWPALPLSPIEQG